MANAILCKHCLQQETAHTDNPQKFRIVTPKEADKLQLDKDSDPDYVSTSFSPDVKAGDAGCQCKRQKKWCDGKCDFATSSTIDEYQD